MIEKILTTPSLPTVRRLPTYLRLLKELQDEKQLNVSSTYIAERFQLEPIQVRKDLAAMGIVGQPRLGFAVTELTCAIMQFLGWNNASEAFLIGAGNLGSALAGYSGFADYGLNIVAAFDVDKNKTGTRIHDIKVFPLQKLPDLARRLHVHIGILTLPAAAAQSITDMLVKVGIKAIWNFTPVKLKVPEDVIVEKVDLAASLAVLSRSLKEKLPLKIVGGA
jgi:redox-sensing transcriptional repressor